MCEGFRNRFCDDGGVIGGGGLKVSALGGYVAEVSLLSECSAV